MKLGDISISSIQPLFDTIRAEGKDPSRILEKFSISPAMLNHGHSRISLSRLMYMGRDAIELTGKPWLGLLMGKNIHLGNIGLPGWAAITAATLSDVLSTYVSYELLDSQNIRGHSQFHIDAESGGPVCQFPSLVPYNAFNYFCVDYALGRWYQLATMVTDHRGLLQRVEVEYKDVGYSRHFEHFFQCPIYYSADKNALIFHPQTASLPSQFASPARHQHAMELADRELATKSSPRRFSDRVVEELTPLLTKEPPQIDELSEKMGLTSWTLRRRLKKENTSFQELLDITRKDLALCYVADTIHSFSEVSYILGFSSTSSFYKAFKRWTGSNPGNYRNARASNPEL